VGFLACREMTVCGIVRPVPGRRSLGRGGTMLRSSITACSLLLLSLASLSVAHANGTKRCATIAGGTIYTTDGEPITLGFDDWGYNYQARLFVGEYCDFLRGNTECDAAYAGVRLLMTWNDAWLSTRDCDGDGELDRHLGHPSYIGSGARLTNYLTGSYELDGRTCHWRQRFVIKAAPSDAELVDGVWYAADGEELGPVVWGEFIEVRETLHDPCAGAE
jgi:hypothetical protein